jgi:nucleoside-diphosphate kinase
MAIERTLSIIKPDAVKKGVIGACLQKLESAGLKIVAMKQMHLTVDQARAFYAVHKARPFYNSLVEFMSSSPVVVSVLEGEDAIATNRKVMGATDPAKAEPNTIRKLYATNIEQNAVHGSDAPETAKQEIAFFFAESAIVHYDRSA